jgi:hypothetical protein
VLCLVLLDVLRKGPGLTRSLEPYSLESSICLLFLDHPGVSPLVLATKIAHCSSSVACLFVCLDKRPSRPIDNEGFEFVPNPLVVQVEVVGF